MFHSIIACFWNLSEAPLIIDVTPDVSLGSINAKKDIQQESLIPKIKSVFQLALLLAAESDSESESYQKIRERFERVANDLKQIRNK